MHNVESNFTYDRAARVARVFKDVATAVSLLLAPLLAPLGQAQEKPSPASDSASDELEIVVTGTLIRGVAPIGTHVLDVSSQDITMIGATDTNQILAKIPQVSS